jgi:hypothetical protein
MNPRTETPLGRSSSLLRAITHIAEYSATVLSADLSAEQLLKTLADIERHAAQAVATFRGGAVAITNPAQEVR